MNPEEGTTVGQAHWLKVHAQQHQSRLDAVQETYTHVGDTPDGLWGLFVPKERPTSLMIWLAVLVVRYELAEDRQWDVMDLTHNGERFGGSPAYFRLREWYPDTVVTWDAALRRLYLTIPCRNAAT